MSVILVTGASRGIGAACARELAERGNSLILHGNRNLEAAERLRDALPGGPHFTIAADLSDENAAQELFERAVEEAGAVDVLVNNAGIFEEHPPHGSFEDWKRAWDETLRVNLLAPVHLMYFAARHFHERGGGRIVNVTSRGAFRGEPTAPAYGASKAGLNSAGQSMAKALGRDGILVFTVAPGWVETDMAAEALAGEAGAAAISDTAIGRVATPEEVAQVVAFLASDAPASLTGCVIDVNGGSYLRT
ncbi:MAG TPA: SDR family oxidoreductase [bacterium]|nr:SDR family oxidoreductase [bacterium]